MGSSFQTSEDSGNMMKFIIAFIVILGVASAAPKAKTFDEIPIQDCGSKAEIQSITFDGCSSLPCKIVGIIVGGIELPFNGCPVNACDNLSMGDCSVEEGEMLVYDMSIPILDVYPKIEITGKWMLKDDMGEDFLCFTIPMKIK